MLRSVLASTFVLFCVRASAQSVISAHSGLVNVFEGDISIDGRPVPEINGRFPEIPQGSLLTTNDGRAEILLAPEVFLWLGRHSAMRMQRNSLADIRVELLEGAAIIQSSRLPSDNAVTLIQSEFQVRLSAQSLYRIDASFELTVLHGEANVTNGLESFILTGPRRFMFPSRLIATPSDGEPDSLDQWALERRQTIASDLNRGAEAGANSTKRRARTRHAYPAVMLPVPRRTW